MLDRPALAAYAAADAEVFPVDAQTTACTPAPTATLSATVMPRSLNEPVGLAPSTLIHVSQRNSSDSFWAATSGVPPSPRVITGSLSDTGSQSR